jgi:hypothetical protein
MPYALYSDPEKQRISDLFPTEKEMWAYVRAQGFCHEAVDRDDREGKRVLFPEYAIFVCGDDGQPLDDPIRELGLSEAPSNINLFRAIIERGFNSGDLSVADEVCSRTMIEHEYLAKPELPGPEILKDQIREARAATPDLSLSIEDIVTDTDRLAVSSVQAG